MLRGIELVAARCVVTPRSVTRGLNEVARRLIAEQGARERALILFEWTRRRDERARQVVEEEPVQTSAPAEFPWWAMASSGGEAPPPADDDEPFVLLDDDEDEEEEPARRAEPITSAEAPDAADIAEHLEALNREQLERVAEAFSEPTDGDDEMLRHRLMAHPDEYANDAADDAEHDPEAAREDGRREALGFLAEEIDNAKAATSTADR